LNTCTPASALTRILLPSGIKATGEKYVTKHAAAAVGVALALGRTVGVSVASGVDEMVGAVVVATSGVKVGKVIGVTVIVIEAVTVETTVGSPWQEVIDKVTTAIRISMAIFFDI
jgi:hypothetical protein